MKIQTGQHIPILVGKRWKSRINCHVKRVKIALQKALEERRK